MSTDFKGKAEAQLLKLKKRLETLEVHLNLGKMEAEDKFEELKTEFAAHAEAIKQNLEAKANDEEVKRMLDELRLQLELGKAEGKDAFEAQKKQIEEKLSELQAYVKKQGESDFKDLKEDAEEFAERLQQQLDLLQLNFTLGKADAEDELRKRQQELAAKAQELRKKVEEVLDGSSEKVDDFSSEMKEAYQHIVKAFKALIA